jgi:TonB family protein
MLREHRRLTLAVAAAMLTHVFLLSLGQSDFSRSTSPRSDLQARWWASTETSGAGSSEQLSPEQQYIERWRGSMERFATRQWSDRVTGTAARQSPILEVVVRADGSLGELRIRRSSGDRGRDRVATELVREAAPFETFPTTLAARHQSLRFAYEWRFETGGSTR